MRKQFHYHDKSNTEHWYYLVLDEDNCELYVEHETDGFKIKDFSTNPSTSKISIDEFLKQGSTAKNQLVKLLKKMFE